jgi:hypothetical protein
MHRQRGSGRDRGADGTPARDEQEVQSQRQNRDRQVDTDENADFPQRAQRQAPVPAAAFKNWPSAKSDRMGAELA